KLDPACKDVDIRIEGPAMPATLNADVDQLRLVFTNLVLNAAQAMDGRGRIHIGAALPDDGSIEFLVSDSGPGIPVELRERVFEPFFTTKVRGTGLGLPTARRIVEAHGGTMTIVEPPGGGTAVRIWLPR